MQEGTTSVRGTENLLGIIGMGKAARRWPKGTWSKRLAHFKRSEGNCFCSQLPRQTSTNTIINTHGGIHCLPNLVSISIPVHRRVKA